MLTIYLIGAAITALLFVFCVGIIGGLELVSEKELASENVGFPAFLILWFLSTILWPITITGALGVITGAIIGVCIEKHKAKLEERKKLEDVARFMDPTTLNRKK